MTPDALNSRPWVHALYSVALLLLLQPIAETMAVGWPVRLGEVGWRFGVTGSFLTLLGTFAAGLGLASLAAYLLGHRLVLRTIGILAIVLACVITMILASFALDWVQLRRMVRADVKGGFDLAAVKSLVAALLGIIAFAAMGWTGISASRQPGASRQARRRTSAGEGIVIGSPRARE